MTTKLMRRVQSDIDWRAIADRVNESGDVAFSSYGTLIDRMRGGSVAYTDENAHYHITSDIDDAMRTVAGQHGLSVDFGHRGANEPIIFRAKEVTQ